MDKEKFALNQGRQRPPYKPKDIHCPNCGAGLTIKDERSELVVCEYCDSHLDVTKEQKTVLGKGPDQKWEFPLQIGDSYNYKGARYEIISRMAFIEDGDMTELSRQYLLYNPRHGTLWLDEYKGNYSLSWDTHVMPISSAFGKRRGDVLETYDNRKWVMEGSGIYELAYVDGALPWIAHVGDQIQYSEFSEKAGTGLQYEVQRIQNEIEYGMGQSLTIEDVRNATNLPNLMKGVKQVSSRDAAQTRKSFMRIMAIAVIIVIINVVLLFYCISTGKRIFTQSFSADELTGEVFSDPFTINKANEVIKIEASASTLSNAWMALDIGVVKDDNVLHVTDSDLSYYHGYEGGESWTEGSISSSKYIKIPNPGTYKLFLHAVSAQGEALSSDRALHGLSIGIESGVLVPTYFKIVSILSIIMLILTIFFYIKWKDEDNDDDDDD